MRVGEKLAGIFAGPPDVAYYHLPMECQLFPVSIITSPNVTHGSSLGSEGLTDGGGSEEGGTALITCPEMTPERLRPPVENHDAPHGARSNKHFSGQSSRWQVSGVVTHGVRPSVRAPQGVTRINRHRRASPA